ncbi:hypothetical protein ScalyP_jg10193, partial [Parmales sp. scaly parma]
MLCSVLSLSATRICRGILAEHAGVKDSRFLGGERGEFDDARNNGSEAIFAAKHLLTSKSLGDY